MALVLVTGGVSGVAAGQSTTNFDTLSTGTVITTQYPGVTFSGVGGTGSCTINAVSASTGQVQSTSSGTRYLGGPAESTSCPTLRMVFTNLQKVVTFKGGTHQSFVTPPPLASDGRRLVITAYDNAGTLISALTQNFVVTAANSGTLNIPITVGSATGTRTIRRIEINSYDNSSAALCRQCVLDDLSFCDTLDTDNPTVTLSAPADGVCICPGSALNVNGTIDAGGCGGYASDVLEYQAFGSSTWTIANGPFSTLPDGGDSYTGLLYSWTPATTLPSGYYFLRATTTNDAGRSGSDVTLVYLDHSPPVFTHTSPPNSTIVRGGVCLVGEIEDSSCGLTYSAAYVPSGSPTAVPISTSVVTWPNLAVWNTTTLPDGAYNVSIAAVDSCSNTSTLTRAFIVDNTPPVARIDSPIRCSSVLGLVNIRGQATDVHFGSWALQFTGGDFSTWVTIASGSSPVVSGGTLANWNTAGLRSCAYTLRLLVNDTATDNCSGGANSAEYTVSVDAGCAADFNHSGGIEVQDIFDFLASWFAGCP